MYGSRAVTLLVLISDDVINRILKLDIQTNILVYVTRCCTDLTSKVLKERTFGQSSTLLKTQICYLLFNYSDICLKWAVGKYIFLPKQCAEENLDYMTTCFYKWAATWDFQQCGMSDQLRLIPACAYAPLLVAWIFYWPNVIWSF